MKLKKSVDELKESVDREIQESVDHNTRWWWIHDLCASGCMLFSIVFSFLAGINVAHPLFRSSSLWAIVLPSLPAFLITVERTLKMSAKARWHWDMVLEYQALQRCRERNEVTPEDASRRISEIEARGDRNYPVLSTQG
jgi:hypothetical protein